SGAKTSRLINNGAGPAIYQESSRRSLTQHGYTGAIFGIVRTPFVSTFQSRHWHRTINLFASTAPGKGLHLVATHAASHSPGSRVLRFSQRGAFYRVVC